MEEKKYKYKLPKCYVMDFSLFKNRYKDEGRHPFINAINEVYAKKCNGDRNFYILSPTDANSHTLRSNIPTHHEFISIEEALFYMEKGHFKNRNFKIF